jgi:predicted phosphodiesterase
VRGRFRWAGLALVVLAGCGLGDGAEPSSPAENLERASEHVGPNAFHFVAIGDWGTGYPIQHALGRRMCELRRESPFDLVVTAGDNIYETGARSDFKPKFYDPFRCLLRNGVQFRAALGNHDLGTRNGRPELNEPRFGMNGRNYVIRKGGVRFVMADSNALRRRWLRRALQTEEGDRWTVVVFHHPVYSPSNDHPSEGDFRHTLPPMFEEAGVDLVINGHTHVYSVTEPLHKIRYVITGGGSASPHSCDPRWYTERCIVQYHFLSISAGTERISVVAIGPQGQQIDRFRTAGRD